MQWDGIDDLRVYVIGPIRTGGDMFVGTRNAIDAGDRLMAEGIFPFIPHLDCFWHLVYPHDEAFWLKWDFAWLRTCHAILRLPGASNGGDKEEAFAKTLGIPVFHSVEELLAWRATQKK